MQLVLYFRPLVSDWHLEESFDLIEKDPESVSEFQRDKKYGKSKVTNAYKVISVELPLFILSHNLLNLQRYKTVIHQKNPHSAF